MKYRPEIDGLRAVAVLPVILFHAGFATFSGGFVGVDVFFVISGYLITSILYTEMTGGAYSILRFYERRARRILPALFLVMLVCIPFAWVWLLPNDLHEFFNSILAVTVFASNVLFWSESGYFETAAELKPLLHTWSLAVEEQFYLFFPLLLAVLLRYLTRRWVVAVLAALLVFSLALAELTLGTRPSAAFFLLPTRMWELLIGSLAAIYLVSRQGRPLSNGLLGWAGIAAIAASVFLYDEHIPFPGAYALLPCVGTVLIILFADAGTGAARLLSLRPVVGIGLISYSAYLWHQPLIAFARYRFPFEAQAPVMLGLAALSLVLAWSSWAFVERPFRTKNAISAKILWVATGVASAFFVVVGALGHRGDGFPQRFEGVELGAYRISNEQAQDASWDPLRDLSGDAGYFIGNNAFDRTDWFPGSERPRLLIVGNSHAKDLYNVLSNSQTAQDAFDMARFGGQVVDFARSESDLYRAPNYIAADIVMIATRYGNEKDIDPARDLDALPALVTQMQADGKEVAIVLNIFEFRNFGNQTLADVLIFPVAREGRLSGDADDLAAMADHVNATYHDYFQYGLEQKGRDVAAINESLGRVASETGAVVLDRIGYVCDGEAERCHAVSGDLGKYFYDYGHHTLLGAEAFGQRVDQVDWLGALR